MASTGLALASNGWPAEAWLPPPALVAPADPGKDAFEDPATPWLEHGETLLRALDGTPLYAQRWRPYESRAAVVVLHGLKDHSARYGAFAEALVARGFAVHAYDLRGHARSGGRRAWVESFDDHLTDLDVVMRHVRWHEHGAGYGRVFVVGQGMGASIATLWAITRRAPLSGLVLSGAALQSSEEPRRASATRWVAALAPRLRILDQDLRRVSRDRGTVEDSLRDALVERSPAPARTAVALLDAMEQVDHGARELRVPLLAMHGSADGITSPEGSRRLVARAAARDKQLYLYDGLAHDLLHEPERARVTTDVAAWMTDRAPF